MLLYSEALNENSKWDKSETGKFFRSGAIS